MISKKDKVFIAGHNGMVGGAIFRCLKDKKYKNLITASKKDLDLTVFNKVNNFLKKNKPKIIIICAAKVGGIKINNEKPAEFFFENISIQNNLIHSAFLNNIKKIIFLGSSCIYPKNSIQPIKEEYLLKGKLEPTNEAYAIAKIAGVKMCEFYNKQYDKSHNLDYRSLMPTNLFGYGDNYHLNNSHVVPALIRKIHEAKASNKNVEIWGTGKAKRDFLFVEDLAEIVEQILRVQKKNFFLKNFEFNHLNIGSTEEISIKKLVTILCQIIGFKNKIIFNTKMPDGTMKKLLDIKKLKKVIKFKKTNLKKALNLTYLDYLNTHLEK
jgi:GDP-L-fucose synthase